MKPRKKHYPVSALAGLAGDVKITMRKNLNADATMFGAICKDFAKIADHLHDLDDAHFSPRSGAATLLLAVSGGSPQGWAEVCAMGTDQGLFSYLLA